MTLKLFLDNSIFKSNDQRELRQMGQNSFEFYRPKATLHESSRINPTVKGEANNQIANFETFLIKYESLRLSYENEGISQQSLLLLRRLSQLFHQENLSLSNLPILKSMIGVCKKLMLNDFEILIWAIYLKETAYNRHDFIEYLDTSALFVKKDLNEPDVFKIFETFLAHNHHETYARYVSSPKPQVTLTLRRINFYTMTLQAPFDSNSDKEIHDFNYEVDALEDEHVRREVHTTKIVVDEQEKESEHEHDKNIGSELSHNDNSYSDGKRKSRKRTRGKQKTTSNKNIKNIKQEVSSASKPSSIREKRMKKKSFDWCKDEANGDNSDPPQPLIPQSQMISRNGQIHSKIESKPSSLLFSQYSTKAEKDNDKSRKIGSSKFSFGANPTGLQPAIPPPFKKQPIPSMESLTDIVNFGNLDEAMNFNIINKSIERGINNRMSEEFMSKNNGEQHDKPSNIYPNFGMFPSAEFSKIIEGSNEPNRNILQPTPKYH